MIKKITIDNFKSISQQEFQMAPITILAGTNSSGKTTFLQSILLLSYYSNPNQELERAIIKIKKFKDVRNFNQKKSQTTLSIEVDNKSSKLICDINQNWHLKSRCDLKFEENLFYISSNRIGQEDITRYYESIKFGINGQNSFGFFEIYKNISIEFSKLDIDKTLAGNLKYWIKEILDIDLEVYTEDIDGESIKVGYKSIDTSKILSAFNVGSGVSYVVRIIIMSLMLKKDDVFLIENPEIHLHPKAISNLANFFVFLAKNGVQIIIETHSEHIINKVRYCIYKNEINKNNVVIYYKSSNLSTFDEIYIDQNGKFIDKNQNRIKFSEGFFDANVKDLMELI